MWLFFVSNKIEFFNLNDVTVSFSYKIKLKNLNVHLPNNPICVWLCVYVSVSHAHKVRNRRFFLRWLLPFCVVDCHFFFSPYYLYGARFWTCTRSNLRCVPNIVLIIRVSSMEFDEEGRQKQKKRKKTCFETEQWALTWRKKNRLGWKTEKQGAIWENGAQTKVHETIVAHLVQMQES